MNHLRKYKNDTLNQLSVLCGTSIKPAKHEKCHQLLTNLNFYLQLPAELNLIGIDIGIKNFSFCRILKFNISSFDNHRSLLIDPQDWRTVDLLAQFPAESPEFQALNKFNQFDLNDVIQSKLYVSYLNSKVLQMLQSNSTKGSKSLDVLLIESQRIKSNNNKMTLPNILTNYLFESLFYSNLLGADNKLLLPMNSNKMANFMINRFLDKANQITSTSSKRLRLRLLEFMVSRELIELPNVANFMSAGKSSGITTRKILQWYNGNNPEPIKKLDDFFDSYLYILNFIYNYRNNLYLHHWLVHEWDIEELIDYLNAYQLSPYLDFFPSANVSLTGDLDELITTTKHHNLPPISSITRELWKL